MPLLAATKPISVYIRDWGLVRVMPFTCIDCGRYVRALDAGWHILYGHKVDEGFICDDCQCWRLADSG